MLQDKVHSGRKDNSASIRKKLSFPCSTRSCQGNRRETRQKLVESQTPIIMDSKGAGATLVTSERLVGER